MLRHLLAEGRQHREVRTAPSEVRGDRDDEIALIGGVEDFDGADYLAVCKRRALGRLVNRGRLERKLRQAKLGARDLAVIGSAVTGRLLVMGACLLRLVHRIGGAGRFGAADAGTPLGHHTGQEATEKSSSTHRTTGSIPGTNGTLAS